MQPSLDTWTMASTTAHNRVSLTAASGGLLGVLTTLEGLFQPVSTHADPSTVAGFGTIALVLSVLGALAAHFGLSKTEIAKGTSEIETHLPEIEALLEKVPSYDSAIAEVKSVAAKAEKVANDAGATASKALAQIPDGKALASEVLAHLGQLVSAAPAVAPAAAPAPAAAAESAPIATTAVGSPAEVAQTA